MFKKILFLASIICYSVSFAQESETDNVAFAVIENVPVYPGCTDESNMKLKKCMSDKISAFVNIHFDMKKIAAMDLPPKTYRTSVQFKIDNKGNVVDVRARAEYPAIEKEAVRVVSNLPQMKPGKQKGKEVGVLYALPIIFKIEPPTKKELKRKNKNKRKG
ncbi:energy transducer TonB [Aequorivita capsosiphonis]|uniref:energy transducer TonB n=1 Tax=Aequorivita capsosiphonis TaxID=487317 RepID=UPI0003F65FE1|nr:energy transducer TonB [Aequorivita capsosiphonis]